MRLWLALLILAPGAAAADVWSEAHRLERAELPDLFWSAATSCAGRADDLLRRQCQGLVAARARAWAGGTYVVRADEGALAAGVVRGCLACVHPLTVAGEPRFVVTRGNVAVEGDGLVGPELARPPEGGSGPIEIVFRLPLAPEAWTQGAQRGFFVEAVAWRFVTAPAARPAPAPQPTLPEQPTAAQIRSAMAPVQAEVDACFESYGVPGTADLGFEVGGDGTVRHAEVRGELADTPTAACIVAAVQKVVFPPFRRPSMFIQYPFILR